MTEALTQLITALAGQPWALVACVGIGGLIYVMWGLSKNTEITKALGTRIADAPAEKLDKIHSAVTQIAERQIDIQGRVNRLEKRIDGISCANAPTCSNRDLVA